MTAFLLCFLLGVVWAGPHPRINQISWNNFLQADDAVKETVTPSSSSRSGDSIDEIIEEYVESQNVNVEVPLLGNATLTAKNLKEGVVDLNLRFDIGDEVQARSKSKSKLKKIFAPILVFILLKAITLIPLALGVLAIKAWNAIQLSFVSFVAAITMAVWKLCSKVNHEPPQIVHQAWDPHDRTDAAQQMAYSAHVPQQ